MTVVIKMEALGELEKNAAEAVDRHIAGRPYDSDLRQMAITAIVEYEPAYVRMSDYDDQFTTNAAIWAMGGMLGVYSLDPPYALRGLRVVLDWRQGLMEPDAFDRWMRVVLKNLKPVNAMADIDHEILRVQRGISKQEVA